MSDFVILTDSSADLPPDLVRQIDVQVLPLSFILADHTYYNYPDNRDMDPHVFYDRLRGGEMATTNAVNVAQYTEALEPLLQAGKDVLILAFSSGLSATYNASRLAVEELSAQYPDRRLYTVDTLCASLGQGLLVWYATRQRDLGHSIEEVRDWVEEHKLNLCHQFTVDDLHFLKRGAVSLPPPPWWAPCSTLNPSSMWTTRATSLISARPGAGRPPSRPWWTGWRTPPSIRAASPSSSATATARRTPKRWPTW